MTTEPRPLLIHEVVALTTTALRDRLLAARIVPAGASLGSGAETRLFDFFRGQQNQPLRRNGESVPN